MKCFVKIILCCLFLFVANLTHAQVSYGIEDFPSHEEVVEHFYETYSGMSSYEHYIEFARKPDGWYVLLKPYTDPSSSEDHLFFDTEKGYMFLGGAFEQEDELSPSFKQHKEWLLSAYNERMFRIHTYFGYRGWGDDIVRILEPVAEELPDQDLYSLARACAAVSGSIAANDNGASRLKRVEHKAEGNSFTKETESSYNTFNQKARKYYNMLAKRNPTFRTIVGSIGTKYANEVMQAYLDYFICQNEEEAREQVVRGIYGEQMRVHAKNILSNCPKNSVFISFGDNDYYPLKYLQVAEGYREDVIVINYSLLGLPSYVQALRRDGRVKLVLPRIVYDRTQVLQFRSTTEAIPWYDVQKQLVRSPDYQLEFGGGKIILNRGNESLELDFSATMFKHHLALMDLISANPDRPFCTPNETSPLDIFKDHLTRIGYLFQLTPNLRSVDTKACLKYFETIDSSTYQNSEYTLVSGDGEFVNPVFNINLYGALFNAICAAKQEEANEYNQLKAILETWRKHWLVQPDPEALEKYRENCD